MTYTHAVYHNHNDPKIGIWGHTHEHDHDGKFKMDDLHSDVHDHVHPVEVLQEMNVSELSSLAEDEGVDIPAGAKKADIVKELDEAGVEAPEEEKPAKEEKPKTPQTGGKFPEPKKTEPKKEEPSEAREALKKHADALDEVLNEPKKDEPKKEGPKAKY